MQYMLYHRRSDGFRGEILYPLNQLASVAPELYEAQRAKYDGRAVLMRQRLPLLNCLWNDVIHFSPVHPGKLKELAVAEGFVWQEADWFEIDSSAAGFTRENALIFLHLHAGVDLVTIPPEEFETYSARRVAALSEIPEVTRKCYRAAREGRAKHFLFAGVPHVLYKGALSVASMRVIRI